MAPLLELLPYAAVMETTARYQASEMKLENSQTWLPCGIVRLYAAA